jgi:3-hydroxy-9,10-secoandrosta-1,3,5(10)-triene-9,17-dione monooxygenase reductase component
MTDPNRYVHYTDPFATPADQRTPARRLRGRLASAVTVWTSGGPSTRAGLTISSLVVAEGSPSVVMGLMTDTSSLWESIDRTHAFVVHILGENDRVIADRFAGLRPSPGGVFAGLDLEDTEWGPALAAFADRVYCRFSDAAEAGYQRLVSGEIERVELGDLTEPLVYFRGRYRGLGPDRRD